MRLRPLGVSQPLFASSRMDSVPEKAVLWQKNPGEPGGAAGDGRGATGESSRTGTVLSVATLPELPPVTVSSPHLLIL